MKEAEDRTGNEINVSEPWQLFISWNLQRNL
jgi:hypothetical protein